MSDTEDVYVDHGNSRCGRSKPNLANGPGASLGLDCGGARTCEPSLQKDRNRGRRLPQRVSTSPQDLLDGIEPKVGDSATGLDDL